MKKQPTKPKTPKADATAKSKKRKYKVRNWKEYNEMLVNRGRLIFHITKEAVDEWEEKQKTGKRGAPKIFTDAAIETALTIREYFGLDLRGTEGVVATMLATLGTSCNAPDYTTLSKRGRAITVDIRVRKKTSNEPLHLVVDSSGFKVYGEGEWKVRQHGVSKRRTWKKLHLGGDAKNGDIEVALMTENDVHDSTVLPEILRNIPTDMAIADVAGDGAYDTRSCYDAIGAHNARALIPPRKDAKIMRHGNKTGVPHPRDTNLRRIRKIGRARWKDESGYHKRSRSENTFFRLKTLFGDRLASRTKSNQRTELLLRVKLLNRFTLLGMPESYIVE